MIIKSVEQQQIFSGRGHSFPKTATSTYLPSAFMTVGPIPQLTRQILVGKVLRDATKMAGVSLNFRPFYPQYESPRPMAGG